MKNIKLLGNLRLLCKLNAKSNKVDYYIVTTKNEYLYAFTRKYSTNTYQMCKAGIRIDDIRYKRSKDPAIMNLVQYTNYMLPYLLEYYELAV